MSVSSCSKYFTDCLVNFYNFVFQLLALQKILNSVCWLINKLGEVTNGHSDKQFHLGFWGFFKCGKYP